MVVLFLPATTTTAIGNTIAPAAAPETGYESCLSFLAESLHGIERRRATGGQQASGIHCANPTNMLVIRRVNAKAAKRPATMPPPDSCAASGRHNRNRIMASFPLLRFAPLVGQVGNLQRIVNPLRTGSAGDLVAGPHRLRSRMLSQPKSAIHPPSTRSVSPLTNPLSFGSAINATAWAMSSTDANRPMGMRRVMSSSV